MTAVGAALTADGDFSDVANQFFGELEDFASLRFETAVLGGDAGNAVKEGCLLKFGVG